MAWLEISGIINFSPGDITEDQFLGVYGLFASELKGSEGGLNISFTKTKRKNWTSSAEDFYETDDIYRIENVNVTGSLRHIEKERALEMVETVKELLYKVRDRMNPNMASFAIRHEDLYWNVCIIVGKVRVKRVKMFL